MSFKSNSTGWVNAHVTPRECFSLQRGWACLLEAPRGWAGSPAYIPLEPQGDMPGRNYHLELGVRAPLVPLRLFVPLVLLEVPGEWVRDAITLNIPKAVIKWNPKLLITCILACYEWGS